MFFIGILLLAISQIQAENSSDVIKSELTRKYPGYGKTWMFFPDGEGNPTPLILNPEAVDIDTEMMSHSMAKAADSAATRTEFHLYTRQNKEEYFELQIDDEDRLKVSNFDPSKDTKFITHGWRSSGRVDSCKKLKDAFLQREDVNVIIVDWSDLASNIIYPVAKTYTKNVGEYYAEMIDFLVDNGAKTDQMHLIGHSLGAHVSGVAGNSTKKGKVHRITGLDPAMPLFESMAYNEDRLDEGDAFFVDTVHTCAGILGFSGALGHVDLYANGGSAPQPGCGGFWEFVEACSHGRSWDLFHETVISEEPMKGVRCDSWDEYVKKKNDKDAYDTVIGYPVDTSTRGTFYFETNPASPYIMKKF
ncbi:pancreatic lipase-related protein 2-like [Chrysoperla carnea]|uniref:pancreatic lipase-related protein 2-like n=1 Tax=Chrysoperla carnea TaxID=189513 RepID=UPI001D094D9C|nr:pancreatic lipase-related protein 2-like [Chrysoperla carnea]